MQLDFSQVRKYIGYAFAITTFAFACELLYPIDVTGNPVFWRSFTSDHILSSAAVFTLFMLVYAKTRDWLKSSAIIFFIFGWGNFFADNVILSYYHAAFSEVADSCVLLFGVALMIVGYWGKSLHIMSYVPGVMLCIYLPWRLWFVQYVDQYSTSASPVHTQYYMSFPVNLWIIVVWCVNCLLGWLLIRKLEQKSNFIN